FIDRENDGQKEEIKTLENGEIREVNQLIEEGKKEKSENREEVTTEDKI
ncbi:MAG: endonuclease/exonuclease/phosphatase family protein, partial [Cloacibacterium normanense]|nr:endonuclease/exonuclease/phosphatase family protein [Cloacibacterium normanense]